MLAEPLNRRLAGHLDRKYIRGGRLGIVGLGRVRFAVAPGRKPPPSLPVITDGAQRSLC